MKKYFMVGFLLIMVMLILQFTGGNNCLAAPQKEGQFKVVGYYSGALFDEPVENLATDKLTHIIYAFLIPREFRKTGAVKTIGISGTSRRRPSVYCCWGLVI